ncbi:hypothetical protein Droror1_Dr00005322 [Drosera rotundifolia]
MTKKKKGKGDFPVGDNDGLSELSRGRDEDEDAERGATAVTKAPMREEEKGSLNGRFEKMEKNGWLLVVVLGGAVMCEGLSSTMVEAEKEGEESVLVVGVENKLSTIHYPVISLS